MTLLDGEGGEGCYASWKFLGSDWRYSMEKRDLLIHFGWPLRSKEEVTKIQWFGKRFPDSRAKYNTLFTFGWRPVPVTVSLPREIDVAAIRKCCMTHYIELLDWNSSGCYRLGKCDSELTSV
jgi:hypothetical protein